jgi:hypothetical protein
LEFFDPSGALTAFKTSSDASQHCWSADDLPVGLYWVRIQTTGTSGPIWSGTQKVLVTR